MSPELSNAIKNDIGYTNEEAPRCSNCVHHREDEGVVDRSWDSVCTLPGTLGVIMVEPTGRCSKFKKQSNLPG